MFIGHVFVHPTSSMSGATASSPVCAVLGMLFFAAFITLVVIAIVACVMAAFDRDVDRLLHAAIVVAIMAILLAVTWGLGGLIAISGPTRWRSPCR